MKKYIKNLSSIEKEYFIVFLILSIFQIINIIYSILFVLGISKLGYLFEFCKLLLFILICILMYFLKKKKLIIVGILGLMYSIYLFLTLDLINMVFSTALIIVSVRYAYYVLTKK